MKFVKAIALIVSCLAAVNMVSESIHAYAYSEAKKLPDISGMSYKEAFLAVAQSQIGYREDSQGRAIYSEWADQSGQGWCAEFAAWCARQANIPTSIIPTELSASHYQDAFAAMGRYYMVDAGVRHNNCTCKTAAKATISSKDIQTGDIVLTVSRNIGGTAINHTAICLSNDNGQLVTIDGNFGDAVGICYRDYNTVHGICRPDYDADIKLKDISELKIDVLSSVVYSGNEKRPVASVYDGNKKLLEDTDYKLTYSDNTMPGIATIKFTGRCDYTGEVKRSFSIIPQKISNLTSNNVTNSTITLRWDTNTNVTGYEIQMYKKGKWKTVKKTTSSRLAEQRFVGLKSKTTYKFRVRAYKNAGDRTICGKYVSISVKTKK